MKAVLLAVALLVGILGFSLLPAGDSSVAPTVVRVTPVPPSPEQRWEIRPIPPYDRTPEDGGQPTLPSLPTLPTLPPLH